MDLDVLVVAGVGVDIIVRVPELPPPAGDAFLVPPIDTYVAHTGNGVVRGLHALGLRTMLVDVIGADPEGELVLAAYADGPQLRHVVHPAGTRRSVNLVDPAGHRTSFHDPRHPAGWIPDRTLWTDGITRARHVHVSIIDWARHALADAVAAGRTTSTDLQDWDGVSEHHRDFAYGADLVFLSAAALGDRVDEVLAGILDRGRARVAVATDGARGSRVAVPGEPLLAVPAVRLPDRPVVDSNGAGDSYVAAFLATVLAGGSYDAAAAAGSVAGAYACGTAGTHTSFVDRPTLDRLLGVTA